MTTNVNTMEPTTTNNILTIEQIVDNNAYSQFTRAFITRNTQEGLPEPRFEQSDATQISEQMMRHTLRTLLKHNEMMKSGQLIVPKGEYRHRVGIYADTTLAAPTEKDWTFYAKGSPFELRTELVNVGYSRLSDVTPAWEAEIAALTAPYQSPEERSNGNLRNYLRICGGYKTREDGLVSIFIFRNPKPVRAIERPTTKLPIFAQDLD